MTSTIQARLSPFVPGMSNTYCGHRSTRANTHRMSPKKMKSASRQTAERRAARSCVASGRLMVTPPTVIGDHHQVSNMRIGMDSSSRLCHSLPAQISTSEVGTEVPLAFSVWGGFVAQGFVSASFELLSPLLSPLFSSPLPEE